MFTRYNLSCPCSGTKLKKDNVIGRSCQSRCLYVIYLYIPDGQPFDDNINKWFCMCVRMCAVFKRVSKHRYVTHHKIHYPDMILKFYFIFKLYIIVLVLPNIIMNPSQVYMCSPSWTLLPPPSPYHPSGLSQCTSSKHPVSCIEPGLASRFIHDMILFS